MSPNEAAEDRAADIEQRALEAVEWFRAHGGNLSACARQFGLVYARLRRILKKLYPNLSPSGSTGRPRGVTAKTRAAAEWFQVHGGTLYACARKFELAPETLRHAVLALYPGIELPRRGTPPGKRRRKPDGRVPRAAAKMYLEAAVTTKDKVSMREVGRRFNISAQEVSNAVQRARTNRKLKVFTEAVVEVGAGTLEVAAAPSISIEAVLTSIDHAAARLEQGDSRAWDALVAFLTPAVLATPRLLRRAVQDAAANGRDAEVVEACRDYEEQVAVALVLGSSP